MKNPLLLFVLLLLSSALAFGAENNEHLLYGKVWVVNAENIYVKFDNTDGISVGDTLYASEANSLIPTLIVKNLSSISCVGTLLDTQKELSVSTQLIAKKKELIEKPFENIVEEAKTAISPNDQAIKNNFVNSKVVSVQKIDGRISVASYTNESDNHVSTERLRYNLALNADHIANSNLSAETYLSFTNLMSFPAESTDWTGLNNALKIYSLALKYDFSKTATLSFGRKVYNNVSNLGAVDGLMFEKKVDNFALGALVGSRPDYMDYSFNPDLLQFGVYASHSLKNKNGIAQTTFAFFNQMNDFKTDRRFAYLQHANSLVKNFDLFCSFEFDLYKVQNDVPENALDLTSSYISLRYKPLNNLSATLSYDARKNIYYYETFPKNKIDSTLDKETRQGLRFNVMYRPIKYLLWSANAGYNFANTNRKESMNANTYLSYTKLPFDIYGTLSATALRTSAISSMLVYGVSLNRDFAEGKINAQMEYRYGDINYAKPVSEQTISNPSTVQNIGQASLFWRFAKKTTLSANLELTFESANSVNERNNYGSFYVSISQKF